MPPELESVGMIEFNSVAAGIQAADNMLKAASVDPLMVKTICPGKFVVVVHGGVASVQASVNAGLKSLDGSVVDHFVIPNIDPSVIKAMSCGVEHVRGGAVGVIETFSAASCIVSADTAVKAANIDLLEVRIAMGIGGKAFCTMAGDVGPVEVAVKAGAAVAEKNGLLVRRVIIPGISPQILRHIM